MDSDIFRNGCIHVKGAREHNLKDIDIQLPRGRLVVITGVSGSGKSSLAFDTIYAEGYRKYIDSLSTKARNFLDQIKRPDVDYIHGLSPVIAIEQRMGVSTNPRSTVATVTEIADYSRLLWSVCGDVHCPKDGAKVERRSIDDCLAKIFELPEGTRVMLLAPYFSGDASSLAEELPSLRQRGFHRLRVNGEMYVLDDLEKFPKFQGNVRLEIVVDRIVIKAEHRSRVADSLELAFREGSDRAILLHQQKGDMAWQELRVSQHMACTQCGHVYEPMTPRHFSYSHPDGACSECHGLGRTRQFVEDLLVPDPSKSVRSGAIKPWRYGSKKMIIRRNAILKQLAEQLPFDNNIPWEDLDSETKNIIMHGGGDRLFSFKLTRRKTMPAPVPFEGVLADLDNAYRTTSSDGFRARLMAFQTDGVCGTCLGKRLSPLSLGVRLQGVGFGDFMEMTIGEALEFVSVLKNASERLLSVADAVEGLEERLHFLNEVGLDYLTLNRSYRSLSGGEAQRARLATQLGMGLVGVTYVLDEPSIGLHPFDNAKLVQSLVELRDRGNSVVVVEHDPETMNHADYLIELGQGAGNLGGEIVFEGTPEEASGSRGSLTGPFLSGQRRVIKSGEDKAPGAGTVKVKGATENNLQNVDASFPIGLFTCVTGVSGSGKSTLVNEVLANAAAFALNRAKSIAGKHKGIEGLEQLDKIIRVDQSPIGKSPRSNPATYIKLFDHLRTLFASTPLSKLNGYKPARFSFNVSGGRCERCRGDGSIALDMQFLADVYIECPSCRGKRYNRETLEVRFKGYNIAEVLEMTVDHAYEVFAKQPKVLAKLNTLRSVGLGYLKLGQPANTLSGGEAQRIKLSLELSKMQQGGSLYILDEPTTGLHWLDIQKLMDLLFQLRDAGNTIIVIEHNLDVIDLADWIIDLGPGGGNAGGQIVYEGPRSELFQCKKSKTASCLKQYLKSLKCVG